MGAAASHEAPNQSQSDRDERFRPSPPPLGQRPTQITGAPRFSVPPPPDTNPLFFQPNLDLLTAQATFMDAGEPTPPPTVERAAIQTNSVLRNALNLKKNTLKLLPSPENPSVYLLQFDFDATVDGCISVYFAASQHIKRESVEDTAEVVSVSYQSLQNKVRSKTSFSPRLNQQYVQKYEDGIDMCHLKDGKLSYDRITPRYPIVILLEAERNNAHAPEVDQPRVVSQTTFANIVRRSGEYTCNIIRQEVLVGGKIYAIVELYGIAGDIIGSESVSQQSSGSKQLPSSSHAAEPTDENPVHQRRECVICLTEPSTTAVVPCNHLCLCDDCADQLARDNSSDRRRCPICRTPIQGLRCIIDMRAFTDIQSSTT